jgi:hypothetical protein
MGFHSLYVTGSTGYYTTAAGVLVQDYGLWHDDVWLDLPVDKLVQLQTLKLGSLNLLQLSTVSGGITSFRMIRELGLLSGLQHLELSRLPAPSPTYSNRHTTPEGVAALGYSAALSTALSQLTQLTALTLSTDGSWRLHGTVLASGSRLSQLQHLTFEEVGSNWNELQLEALPSSLVTLRIKRCRHPWQLRLDSAPRWQLPVLKHLLLDEASVYPTLLVGMPLLESLAWHGNTDVHDSRCMFDLLPVLSRVQQLTSLHLSGIRGTTTAPEFAALTASSKLEHLQLSDCSCNIPPIAAQCMFAAGRCLPHLRTVHIAGKVAHLWRNTLTLGAGDAGRLAACCPGLQSLSHLVFAAVGAAELQPLLQLSALTQLAVEGAACDDEVAEQVLAKMTGEHALLRILTDTALACSPWVRC